MLKTTEPVSGQVRILHPSLSEQLEKIPPPPPFLKGLLGDSGKFMVMGQVEFRGGPQGGGGRDSWTGGRGFLGELSSGGTSTTGCRFALEEKAGRACPWGAAEIKMGWESA